MIEVKLTFSTIADMLAHFGGTVPVAVVSATVTPEKQQAARDSTAAGKAEKAAKPAKEVKNPETPLEALKEAVAEAAPAEPAKPAPTVARTYETSGLAEKIAKGAAKDKPATIALLHKHKALNAEGKPNGKALPVDAFDAFEADIDALLAAEPALG
jgi:hypothetical protein